MHSGVALQMIMWMFDGDSFSESLRNECPKGFSKLLRRWMIVGVLKRVQTMSVSETGVMCVSTLYPFKKRHF